MYYVMMGVIPLKDNFEKHTCLGAYVNCWVDVDSMEKAVEEAKNYVIEHGWKGGGIEDIDVVQREQYEDDMETLAAFDEAKEDGISGIFYTFDNDDMSEENDTENCDPYIDEKLDLIEEEFADGKEDNINFLVEMAHSEDSYIRSRVAVILVDATSDIAKETLLMLSEDEDELVRTEACDSLCWCNDEKVYEHLKKKAKKEKSWLVRGYAICSSVNIALEIDRIDDVLAFLNELEKTENKVFVRINIATGKYLCGNKESLNDLLRYLNDIIYNNRCAVINSFYEILDEDNYSVIKKALEERREKEEKTTVAVISAIDELLNEISDNYDVE